MSNQSIALITDITCDIPPELVEQYGITIIPQAVVWGDEILLDRVDISPTEFYRRIVTDPVLPTTTQPGPKDFERVYLEAIDQGAEEIVIFTVSSALSESR